jgi:hypothetical protein
VLVLTPGFLPPTTTGTPHDEWVSGLGATSSDGAYVSSDTLGARQSYGSFSFTIPSGDTITGIVVQLEASADSAGGQVAVALSWDGGVSTTTAYFTPLLTTTDTVYTLGGQNDDWGRVWSLADVETDNFRLRLIAQPDGNTIRVDAIAARVWHQASGGGGGAGDPLP